MNITQIKADVRYLAGATSGTYPDETLMRNVNISYQDIARIIRESQGTWQYDDSNATGLAIASANLVASQQDYELPTTLQRLERVEVADGSGNFQKLRQINYQDVSMAMPEYHETDSTPLMYDILGRSIMLYPAPAAGYVTTANGIRIYYDRDVEEFAASASTASPGFGVAFHRILSYAAALDFVQDEAQRNFLIQQRDRLERGLIRFYSQRNVEVKGRIRPAGTRKPKLYS